MGVRCTLKRRYNAGTTLAVAQLARMEDAPAAGRSHLKIAHDCRVLVLMSDVVRAFVMNWWVGPRVVD